MGIVNGNTGYPKGVLETRAIIRKGNFALIPPNGLVGNIIPGFEKSVATILSSPKLGAAFVDYLISVETGGGCPGGFGGDGVECFLYVLEGALTARAGGKEQALLQGGYAYCPPDVKLCWEAREAGKLFLYKRRYKHITGPGPEAVFGRVDELEPYFFEGMENVRLWDLLPKDIRYDMNFHILSFSPGASHGYIETHVQEHGALVLSGKGMYRLDDMWVPVEQGDYLFMGAYSPQGAYGVGREAFTYLYSKDCNRDELI